MATHEAQIKAGRFKTIYSGWRDLVRIDSVMPIVGFCPCITKDEVMTDYDPLEPLIVSRPVELSIERDLLEKCMNTLNVLCEDLETELRDRYQYQEYPTEQRRFNNDMEPVLRGRDILRQLSSRKGYPMIHPSNT